MNLVTIIILFFLVYTLGDNIVTALGGSVLVTILIAIGIFLSRYFKEFKLQYSILSFVLLLLLIQNYLYWAERYQTLSTLSITILWIIDISIIVYLIARLLSTLSPSREYHKHYDTIVIIRKKLVSMFTCNMVFSSMYILITGIMLLAFEDEGYVIYTSSNIYNLSNIYCIIFLIFLFYTFFYIKRKFTTSILYLLSVKDCRVDVNSKLLFVPFAIFIALGSFLESVRNNWILWFYTLIVILTITMVLVKLIQKQNNKQELILAESNKVPLNIVRYTVIHIIIGNIYAFSLLFLLLVTRCPP